MLYQPFSVGFVLELREFQLNVVLLFVYCDAGRSHFEWHSLKRALSCPLASRSNSSAVNALAAARQLLENELESIRQAGTFKHERVITSKQAVSVQVQGQLKPLLNFCANNYLGLSVSRILMNPLQVIFIC